MRLNVSGSGNSKSFYIIKSVKINGKNTSKVVEKLGNLETVTKLAYPEDPYEWGRKRAKKLTMLEEEENAKILVKYAPNKKINSDEQRLYNGGYLFLQKIYYELEIDTICQSIREKHQFKYDLNEILSRLIYSRILFPASKKATYELSNKYIEQSSFELHQIYRALEVLAPELDYIQAELYKNSKKVTKRNEQVLFYDCTNYFFEIENDDDFRKYGKSKENRPNPIVQMGLFMDGNGFPLAFSMTPGNQNEQTTLKPLEKKIIHDFGVQKMIVCTDAGLSSNANRKFNDRNQRKFITTQSLKKLNAHLKLWALSANGWRISNSKQEHTITEIQNAGNDNQIYYKERWINENGLEQRMIVTYSLKYQEYQKRIRNKQIERAISLINRGITPSNKKNPHDVKRFIKETRLTGDGEIAENIDLSIDQNAIDKEAMYDGYYGVCTNLEGDVNQILKINQSRWEIEESFRIMKSEFKARPVNLSRKARIESHFCTCFLSLLIFRILEKRLSEKYTCHELLKTIREMNFHEIKGEGMIPLYTRNDITDDLHDIFGFETDFQFIPQKKMNKILKQTKK